MAQTQPVTGDRGFSSREYGAVLWEMPDASLLRGPITWGTHSFLEASSNPNARASVELNWTPPAPGAFPYATVHSHPPAGRAHTLGDTKSEHDRRLRELNVGPAVARVSQRRVGEWQRGTHLHRRR